MVKNDREPPAGLGSGKYLESPCRDGMLIKTGCEPVSSLLK